MGKRNNLDSLKEYIKGSIDFSVDVSDFLNRIKWQIEFFLEEDCTICGHFWDKEKSCNINELTWVNIIPENWDNIYVSL